MDMPSAGAGRWVKRLHHLLPPGVLLLRELVILLPSIHQDAPFSFRSCIGQILWCCSWREAPLEQLYHFCRVAGSGMSVHYSPDVCYDAL